MIRVLHTGDLHLDSPFGGLAPAKAKLRRQEQRELLERLRKLVEERQIDVVLIAGDLFDSDHVYYETTHMLADVLGQMPAKVFIAPGNHDPYSDYSPYASVKWPENVHVFHSEGMERVELPELHAVVYGSAFTSKYRDNSPLEHFKADYDEDMTRLMVVHGDLSPAQGRYGSLTAEQIGATGMDYVALGHIHSFTEVWKQQNTAFAYCGCPEGRGFDEQGEKGVLIGTVERGKAEMEFLPVCRRRYEEVTLDVTGQDAGQLLSVASASATGDDIYRFRMVGEREGEPLRTQALAAMLARKYFDVQVIDETTPVTDLWARADEDTLTGLFLRNMRARVELAESPEERAQLERAARFGLAALEGREEPR